MATHYKLIAVPILKIEGEAKVGVSAVIFISASETATHRWQCVNTESFEKDFQGIVSPELAKHAVETLKAGKTFEFPNLYELDEVRSRFGD